MRKFVALLGLALLYAGQLGDILLKTSSIRAKPMVGPLTVYEEREC